MFYKGNLIWDMKCFENLRYVIEKVFVIFLI